MAENGVEFITLDESRSTTRYEPPRFTIDLSKDPRDRYRAVTRAYRVHVRNLTSLFDDLLKDVGIPQSMIGIINLVSRLLLRQIHVRDQTEELHGVSDEADVPMYLLVAFNIVLDMLMGCTSGAVISAPRNSKRPGRMLHFRTLDWSMDPLRIVIVQLDFVRSRSETPTKILASSITYVGFVGVLTGVRPGLSMSLNFRALHDTSSKFTNFRFYLHHILVLLGWRPSIAAILRDKLIGNYETDSGSCKASRRKRITATTCNDNAPDLATVCNEIDKYHTTAAYLILSDGQHAVSVDKDYRTSRVRMSDTFIANTNHDVIDHGTEQDVSSIALKAMRRNTRNMTNLQELFDESEDRLKCLTRRWQRHVIRRQKRLAAEGLSQSLEQVERQSFLTQRQVIDWVSKFPTTNECTHFAAVMDPTAGTVIWCEAYPESPDG